MPRITITKPYAAITVLVAVVSMLLAPTSAHALSCIMPQEPQPFDEFQRYLQEKPDETMQSSLLIGVVGEPSGTTYPVHVEVVLHEASEELALGPPADGAPLLHMQTDRDWGPDFAPGRWALVVGHGPTDGPTAQLCAPHVAVTAKQGRQLIKAAGKDAVVYSQPGAELPTPPPPSPPSLLVTLLLWLASLLTP